MSLAEIHKKAKLVMIPSGAKATKLYSVLPSNGDGDFTTTSDTDATRVNKDGLIQDIAVNVPRLDYDSSNPQNPHLLLEPQSINKVTQSETFSTWNTTNASLTSANLAAPDGSNSVIKMSSSNIAGGEHKVRFNTDTTTATSSIFAKMGEVRYIMNRRSTTQTGFQSVVFDLQEGVVERNNYSTNAYPKITYYGNGWYRCEVYYENLSATGTGWGLSNGTNQIYNAPNTTDGLYIWGAQQEDLSFATSYIPTTDSATTRTIDTCNSAGNSTIINTSEGVLFAEIAALANDSSLRDISINNNSTDRILLSYLNSSNRIAMQFIDGGASQFTLQFDGATITNFNKIAIKYKSSDYALWVNGSERATNTSHTNALAGLDRINFDRGDGGDDFFGKCKQLMYFDTILTDAELTTLTT